MNECALMVGQSVTEERIVSGKRDNSSLSEIRFTAMQRPSISHVKRAAPDS